MMRRALVRSLFVLVALAAATTAWAQVTSSFQSANMSSPLCFHNQTCSE